MAVDELTNPREPPRWRFMIMNMFVICYRSLPCPADEVEDDVARGVAGQGLPYEEPQPIGIRSSNS